MASRNLKKFQMVNIKGLHPFIVVREGSCEPKVISSNPRGCNIFQISAKIVALTQGVAAEAAVSSVG